MVEQNGVLQVPLSQSKVYSAVKKDEEDLYARVQRDASKKVQETKAEVDKSENSAVARHTSQRKLPRTPADSVQPVNISPRPISIQKDGGDILYESIEEVKPNLGPTGSKGPSAKGNVSNGHIVYENIEGGKKRVPISPITPEYKKQVDNALDSLDQMLDDAMSGNDKVLSKNQME